MGQVVQAHDSELGRDVAIKVMRLPDDPECLRRFQREARGLAGLRHPHVVTVYDFGVDQGTPWLSMELLTGTLFSYLPDGFDPVDPMLQVAEALEAVHDAGMLHRDVKPGNLMWVEDQRAVLIDFGLLRSDDTAQLTRDGWVVGTLLFLAPEILGGKSWTPGADWYAWGASLYCLLERKPPYELEEIMRALEGGYPLPAPSFSRLAEGDPRADLVQACLDPDPAARPHGREELEDILGPRGTRPLSPPKPAGAEAAPESRPASEGDRPAGPGARWVPLLVAGALLLVAVASFERRAPAPSPPSHDLGDLVFLHVNALGFLEYRSPRDGGVMILLPAGTHASSLAYKLTHEGERQRPVVLPALLAGKHEVTVEQYARFLEATGREPPRHWEKQQAHPRRPVIFVTWEDARAFCVWVGGRLPSEVEWEKLAGGPEGWVYPWKDRTSTPSQRFANFTVRPSDTGGILDYLRERWENSVEPVGNYPEGTSPYGALDCGGNVWEFCSGRFVPHADDRGDPVPAGAHVARGGSWSSTPRRIRVSSRRAVAPSQALDDVGFRVFRDPPPSPP